MVSTATGLNEDLELIKIEEQTNGLTNGLVIKQEQLQQEDEKDLVDRSFLVSPIAASLLHTPIHSLGYTNCLRWVYLGCEDAYIRKYDFFASINGKLPLTVAQRHSTLDTCYHSGVLLNYYDNQTQLPELKRRIPSDLDFDESFQRVLALYVHSSGLFGLNGTDLGDINLVSLRLEEGKCLGVLKGHNKPVSVIKCLNKEETKAVSGSWDNLIKIWDLNTCQSIQTLKGHNTQITSISIPSNSSNQLCTTSFEGTTQFWDLRTNQPTHIHVTPPNTPKWCLSSTYSIDNNSLFTGRRHNQVFNLDLRTFNLLPSLKLPINSGPISSIAIHPTRKFLAIGSFDNVRVWNLDQKDNTISPYQLVPGHQSGTVSQMAIDQSGQYMITTSGTRGWEGLSTNIAIFYHIKFQ